MACDCGSSGTAQVEDGAVCGNGIVETGEVCDDGKNDGSYGGCAADCSARAAHCGDGEVNGGEVCDDGKNDGSYGSCAADCSARAAHCGDGEVNGGEVCDDGKNDGSYGSCAADCSARAAHCGDGEVNGGEVCDDGKNDGSYGSCAADCSARAAHCGDGEVNGGEQCDDGVEGNSDSAPNACRTTCKRAHCGDGVLDQGESCDGGENCTEACAIQWTDATQAVTWQVQLDADSPTWKRNAAEMCLPSAIHASGSPYAVYSIANETGADQLIAIAGSHTCLSTLHLYRGTFDPAQPASNCETSSLGQLAEAELELQGDSSAAAAERVLEFEYMLLNMFGGAVPPRNTIATGFELKQGETVSVVVSTQFAEACAGTMRLAAAGCGNGIVEMNYTPWLNPELCEAYPERCAQEQCDDGNAIDGDGCSSTCQVEEGFGCLFDSACQSTCAQPACGNGNLDEGEQCDDGNTADGDGCSSACQLEEGFLCVQEDSYACVDIEKVFRGGRIVTQVSSRCFSAACGDGLVAEGEACDDGNTADGDGCSSACEVEEGFACAPAIPALYASDEHTLVFPMLDSSQLTSTCAPASEGPMCGNGNLESGEQCDDGNAIDGDGCSSACEVEAGHACDFVRQEADLPGNFWNIDLARNFSSCRVLACGDGILDEGEACDDGNTAGGDGCSSACEIEKDWACAKTLHPTAFALLNEDLFQVQFQIQMGEGGPRDLLTTSNCRPITCGDGLVDVGEACDDGNAAGGDGCSATCARERGFVCTAAGQACTRIVCGDGIIEGPGACEDGNAEDGDGCSSACDVEEAGFVLNATSAAALSFGVAMEAGSTVWTRPEREGEFYYEATPLTNQTEFPLRVDVSALWTCDGYLYVFAEPFDPAALESAPLALNDDAQVPGGTGATSGSAVEITIAPNATVVIVSTTYSSEKTCRGTLTVEHQYLDSDGDGVTDESDGCPSDPGKVEAGVCGCGVPDADTDGDGTIDCLDECPSDPDKIEAGMCGCGVLDTEVDTDGDGTIDCLDECPSDPDKIEAGMCGCGALDADTDGDGTTDCLDECPSDPGKVEAGVCGCGVSDADADGDGIIDCLLDRLNACPDASTARQDTDGDGAPDCVDGCPRDAAHATMESAAICSDDGLFTIGFADGNRAAQSSRTTTDFTQELHYVPGSNLLVNPWRLDSDDGWAVSAVSLQATNSWYREWGQGRPFGDVPLLTGSHHDTTMSQTVDLAELSGAIAAKEPLRLGTIAGSRILQPDRIKVEVEWLDSNAHSLGSAVLFDDRPSVEEGFDFRGALAKVDYPEGLSALTISFLTVDGEGWIGHYAAALQGMQVMVGAPKVRFSNDGLTWSDWEDAGWKKEGWQLSEGLGQKTVYMQSYNPVSQRFDVVVDTIEVVAE